MVLSPDERRREARELAEMWSRIGRQHISAGQGCGCGFGGLLLQGSDFELDIVEFLINDARKAGLTNIESFIDAAARRGPDRYSLVPSSMPSRQQTARRPHLLKSSTLL
jgi:hypothetical protein